MALTVVWTERANAGFDEIVEYLEFHFTENEVRSFIEEVDRFLELLSAYPELLAGTVTKSGVHRGPINSHTILTYRVNRRQGRIEIINLRSSRKKTQA